MSPHFPGESTILICTAASRSVFKIKTSAAPDVEMQERSTTFVASEGGCLYIIYGPAVAISELSGGRRTAKRTSQNTKTAARVSKDVIEPLSSSTLEPLCQASLLNMRLKCPFGLRGLWAPRIPLAPLGSGLLEKSAF